MSDKKVIKFDNLPTRLPVFVTVVTMLAMDVWNFPMWAKVGLWTLLAIIWIGSVINIWREKHINIFEDEK